MYPTNHLLYYDLSICRRLLRFELCGTYVVMVSGSLFSVLRDAIARPESIISLAQRAVPSSSVYFLNLLMAIACVWAPLALVRPFVLSKYIFMKRFTSQKRLTRRDWLKGPFRAASFNYGISSAIVLFVFGVAALYLVIAPLVAFAAAVFFSVYYIALKNQFLFVYVSSFETGGRFWYTLFGYTMLSLFVGTIALSVYMAIKRAVIQAPLLLPLAVLILVMWHRIDKTYGALSRQIAVEVLAQKDKEGDDATCVRHFREDYFVQPFMREPGPEAVPVQYRFAEAALFDDNGELHPLYHELVDRSDVMDRASSTCFVDVGKLGFSKVVSTPTKNPANGYATPASLTPNKRRSVAFSEEGKDFDDDADFYF